MADLPLILEIALKFIIICVGLAIDIMLILAMVFAGLFVGWK